MDPTTTMLITVPITVAATFMGILEWLKANVLEPYVPGFAKSDPNHNRNIRALYFVLVFLALFAWAASGTAPGVARPHDAMGWAMLVYIAGNSAGVLLGGAHVTYDQLSGGARRRKARATEAVRLSAHDDALEAVAQDPDPIYPPKTYDAGADLLRATG
jgi:hypothetical protein